MFSKKKLEQLGADEIRSYLQVETVIYSNLDVGEWSAYRRVSFPASIKARLTCRGPNIVR